MDGISKCTYCLITQAFCHLESCSCSPRGSSADTIYDVYGSGIFTDTRVVESTVEGISKTNDRTTGSISNLMASHLD